MRRVASVYALLIAVAFAVPGAAEDYPNRPIRVVVPNPAGGPTDLVARLVSPKLTQRFGQTIVIDNRAGADGVIGSDLVAKAPPDGYTLLLTSSSHSMHPAVYTTMPFDTEAAFVPVTLLVRMPFVLVVHPSFPARSVAELIEAARRQPGKLDYGSAGNGGGVHLTTELFKTAAGIDLVHIPYKGGGPLLNEVVAGQIKIAFLPLATAMPQVQEGKLRALGVSSAQRVAVVPELPSIAATVPGFDTGTWYGLLAPAGTPPDIIARLNGALAPILAEAETMQRITAFGGEPVGGTPDAFGVMIHAEIARWGAVALHANVRLD